MAKNDEVTTLAKRAPTDIEHLCMYIIVFMGQMFLEFKQKLMELPSI